MIMPKKRRLAHYKKAIKVYNQYNEDNDFCGICIVLGEIAYGSFAKSPWTQWEQLVEYYPEFNPKKAPKHIHTTIKGANNHRIRILEAAIKKLENGSTK